MNCFSVACAAACFAACLAVSAAPAAARALIDTDFGVTTHDVSVAAADKDLSVSGVLPEGWNDNSSWAAIRATYERIDEPDGAFLRVNVERVTEGWCQLVYQPLAQPTGESYYRMTARLRSPTSVDVDLGVRTAGPPYTYLWAERNVSPDADWRDVSVDFRMRPVEQPIAFYIVVHGEGVIDISSIRLVEMTRDELLAERRAQYSGERYRNALRVSRFPLGPQSGSTLGSDNSDGDEVLIEVAPEDIGPSGGPVMRIDMREHAQFIAPPFGVPIVWETHTASLYASGRFSGRLVVLGNGREIASAPIAIAGDEWTRFHTPFAPLVDGKAYGLMVEGFGTIRIDALQVAPGDVPSEYAGQRQAEVALAIPDGDASAALVQFDDEPFTVRHCVTGDAKGMLRTTVTDVYGDAVEMEAVEVDVSGHEYGEFACDAASANAYGPFRVEAWVEDADGEHASPVAELVVYRLRRPRYWLRDAPHSPFGVHTNSTTRHCAMAKAVGINWTRLHDAGFQYLGWRYLEPKRGQWAFRDADINRYRTHRIKVLGELGTAPKWASYHGDVGHDHIGYFDQYYQPKRLEDYANYVRTVVQRYQGVIDAYDVWNEPWIPAWWAVAYDETKEDRARYVTSKDPAGDFVALMKTAYKATKAVDEAITILGVNTTAGEDGREWTRGIVDNGGINYSDVVCYHQYTGADLAYPGDAVADGYETAVGAVADRYGEEAPPVWMSEGSSTAGRTGSGMYRQTIPYEATEDVWDTGDRLCRYVVSLLSQGVEKVFLYSMHSHRYFTGEDAGEWRVLTTPEGALNPSGAAHSTMAWHLEDTAFSKRVEPVEGVHAYLFEGTRGSVAVLAPMYEHAPYRVPAGPDMTTTDLFGNPLRDGSGLGATVVFVSTPNGVADLEAALRPAG